MQKRKNKTKAFQKTISAVIERRKSYAKDLIERASNLLTEDSLRVVKSTLKIDGTYRRRTKRMVQAAQRLSGLIANHRAVKDKKYLKYHGLQLKKA